MKTWEQLQKEVEQQMLDRFNKVPQNQRAKLGIDPDNGNKSFEKRQWVQTYVEMLSWKDKCRELHDQLQIQVREVMEEG
jgi:hypothetical protein